MSNSMQTIIDQAWENRATINPGGADAKLRGAVAAVLDQLDEGSLRVAEKR